MQNVMSLETEQLESVVSDLETAQTMLNVSDVIKNELHIGEGAEFDYLPDEHNLSVPEYHNRSECWENNLELVLTDPDVESENKAHREADIDVETQTKFETQTNSTERNEEWESDLSLLVTPSDIYSETFRVEKNNRLFASEENPDGIIQACLSPEAIDVLRNKNYFGERLGLRFGKPSDINGFSGDAYSLIPNDNSGNLEKFRVLFFHNPHMLKMVEGQMTDSEFIQATWASVHCGVYWFINQLMDKSPGQLNVLRLLDEVSDNLGVFIVNMDKKPSTGTYRINVDGSWLQTTPKFDCSEQRSAADIHAAIHIASECVQEGCMTNTLVDEKCELYEKFEQAGIHIEDPLELYDARISEVLTNLIMNKLDEVIQALPCNEY